MNQPMMELPSYKSHKIVYALKIKVVNVEDGMIWIVPEDDRYAEFQVDSAYYDKHKPQAGGYYVVYEDGYKSWSPAEAFENGYTKIDVASSPLSDLKAALKADEDYAWTWLCNLACIALDSGGTHENSNRRAAQFMQNAFDIDVTQCENWKQYELQWSEPVDEPSQLAHEIAARVWCDDEMKNATMNADAAIEIARIIDRVITSQRTQGEEESQPTLDEWIEGWEAAVESGQSRISREEAEKRYDAQYGRNRQQNDDY